MVQIVNRDHPALRAGTVAVQKNLFGSAKLCKILKNMQEALAKEKDGVALAAPQIGVPLRIFVVSPNAYIEENLELHTVFINPTLIRVSKRGHKIEEGCLSVRYLYG